MDGYLYKNQDNDVMCQIEGFEPMVIRVMRPSSMRNAFAMFRYADNYNWDYSDYGKFDLVYDEDDDLPEEFLDEVGGVHDGIVGWNPQGVYCGECNCLTCKDCVNEHLVD